MTPARKMHAHRMRVHQTAIRTMVDEARERVVAARRRYMTVDPSDLRPMIEAQGLYLLALEQYWDASERAAGRR